LKHTPLAAAAASAVALTAGALLAAPSAVAAPHATTAPHAATAPSTVTAASGGTGHNWVPLHGAHRAAPGTARSATAYNGACGSGYGVIDSLPVGSLGTVYLTYNNATGKNCVVTVRATSGSPVFMVAAIRLSGDESSEVSDADFYTSYAGPVYLSAAGTCIDWAGQINNVYTEEMESHCG
jgi:hypothetical protein